jgi:hypothetical protein
VDVMSVEELSKVIVGSWGADLAGSGEARDEAYAALEDALAQVDELTKHKGYEVAFQKWMRMVA